MAAGKLCLDDWLGSDCCCHRRPKAAQAMHFGATALGGQLLTGRQLGDLRLQESVHGYTGEQRKHRMVRMVLRLSHHESKPAKQCWSLHERLLVQLSVTCEAQNSLAEKQSTRQSRCLCALASTDRLTRLGSCLCERLKAPLPVSLSPTTEYSTVPPEIHHVNETPLRVGGLEHLCILDTGH